MLFLFFSRKALEKNAITRDIVKNASHHTVFDEKA
jgi:hypothetical protein